ncbi:hypothetical protein CSA37_11785 [Candidatus Fermentibacteria bacterium]|nr:MAG: hypothetical protein CSA37_11785 [Candidatus Fermentibacteria bacterium]
MSSSITRFQEDVTRTILELRKAIKIIINCLPEKVESPHDVYQVLGLDKKLGWRMYKIVNEEDLFFAAQFVPGRHSFGRFIKSCKSKGVAKGYLQNAVRAVEYFYEIIDIHSGDRHSMDMMLMASSRDGRDQAMNTLRKQSYYAQSHLLGLQAETQLDAWFFGPSAETGMLDVAEVKGLFAIRRNRPGVKWVIDTPCFFAGKTHEEQFFTETIESGSHCNLMERVPFLEKYCSDPLPALKAVTSQNCGPVYELGDGPVGNTSLIDTVTGTVSRGIFPVSPDEGETCHEVSVRLYTPVQNLILDLFFHETMVDTMAGNPSAKMLFDYYSHGGALAYRSDRDIVPMNIKPLMIGSGTGCGYTPLVPCYTEMIADVFRSLRWDPDEFVLYRTSVGFPVVPSTLYYVDKLVRN